MKCPVCNTIDLVMSERKGIEIDYCPQCRGVWLDRGELDKMIERSHHEDDRRAQPQQPQQQYPQPQYPEQRPHPQYRDRDDYYYKKRKKSWLEDIFD